MPRAPLQALVWSAEHNAYDLYRHGRLVQRFGVGDNRSWQRWLATQTCFAYRGHIGLLNVYYEARARGGCYWYAYRTTGRHTTKRYLGRTETVTLERLEQLAALLDAIPAQARSAPTKRAGASTAPAGRAAHKAGHEHHHGPADPSASIPATKLGPPHLPGALVQRERLLDLLSGAVERPLTLISAPAGWGKTTLLSQWLTLRGQGSGIAGRGSGNGSEDRATVSREETTSGRSSGPDPCPLTLSPLIAWLSLDRYDNDPARFWAALIAALRYRHPSLGSGALAMLRVSTAPIAVVTALLVELATLPACRPLVLVLDDVHLINDAAIHEALGLLIDRLPAQVRLVISTRVDPELPLARWRVQGRLAEIRAADLRFVTAEIRTFFAHAPAELPDDIELVQLERRTEGWAAGLQLAALGIPPGDGRAGIAGSLRAGQRFLQEYVHSEIVAQQPLAMQRFLLRSAVLTQLSAGLCRAVTGELASNQLLQALERSHLFLTPLDEQRTWYRFHELFREAVLDQLQATEPELLPRLHRRAARWYAEHGFPREAIAHALAAHDVSTAGALIERVAGQLWHRGEARTVHDWIDALPDSVLARHARLALDAALHLLVAQQFMARAAYEQARHAANRTIARVDSLVSTPTGDAPAQAAIEALPTPLIGLLRRRIELLRAFSAARGLLELGDHQHLQRLAAQVEALGEDVERGWELSRLAIVFRSTIVLKHEGAQLVPMLLEAKQRMLRRGSRRSVIRVLQFLAYAYLRAGALSMARSECRQALELIARDDGLAYLAGNEHYLLAAIDYRSNRLAEAAGALNKALAVAHEWHHVDLLLSALLLRVDIALAAGEEAAADAALREAEPLATHEGYATHVAGVAVAQVAIWLATGEHAAVARWAESTEFLEQQWNPVRKGEFLMLMHVYLAQRRYSEVYAQLERFAPLLDCAADIDSGIRFLSLYAVALWKLNKTEQARTVARRLLALSERDGHVRPFLELGAPMHELLCCVRDRPDATPSLTHSAAAFVSRLLTAFANPSLAAISADVAPEPLPHHAVAAATDELLTRRELDVLRLMAGGASNKEIAAELVISLATVKKHVGNVLGKLGVQRRTQALARAHELSLLA